MRSHPGFNTTTRRPKICIGPLVTTAGELVGPVHPNRAEVISWLREWVVIQAQVAYLIEATVKATAVTDLPLQADYASSYHHVVLTHSKQT